MERARGERDAAEKDGSKKSNQKVKVNNTYVNIIEILSYDSDDTKVEFKLPLKKMPDPCLFFKSKLVGQEGHLTTKNWIKHSHGHE